MVVYHFFDSAKRKITVESVITNLDGGGLQQSFLAILLTILFFSFQVIKLPHMVIEQYPHLPCGMLIATLWITFASIGKINLHFKAKKVHSIYGNLLPYKSKVAGSRPPPSSASSIHRSLEVGSPSPAGSGFSRQPDRPGTIRANDVNAVSFIYFP